MVISDLHITFPVFQSNQQRRRCGAFQISGQEKGDSALLEQGILPTILERRIKRKAGTGRGRSIQAEKGISNTGGGRPGYHGTPFCCHRRNQFYL